jgi:hypothetical protein
MQQHAVPATGAENKIHAKSRGPRHHGNQNQEEATVLLMNDNLHHKGIHHSLTLHHTTRLDSLSFNSKKIQDCVTNAATSHALKQA